VTPFTFALDTQIRFGAGERRTLGATAAGLGTRAMLVTGGRSFDAGGHGEELRALLLDSGVEIVARARTGGEPDDGLVTAAAEEAREARADVVVAVGGGSAMDLAKAIGVVAAGADLAAALEGAPVAVPGIPVIALPTTAGSGAEASRAAIVLHRSAGRKRGVRGRGVAARAAIVDPELLTGASDTVTASAGLDAMAHAIETAVSRVASPVNVLLAGDALRRLVRAIPDALSDSADLVARGSSAYAALLMGINLATSSTCLPHRLQYPLGAVTGTSHARGVAALMPAWLARTRRFAPDRLGGLARAAGLAAPGASDATAAEALERVVLDWMHRIGMRTSLTELGVDRALIGDLVHMAEGTLSNDPGPVEPSDLAALYRESL
jgi:alcohol dehydrogenase class IV